MSPWPRIHEYHDSYSLSERGTFPTSMCREWVFQPQYTFGDTHKFEARRLYLSKSYGVDHDGDDSMIWALSNPPTSRASRPRDYCPVGEILWCWTQWGRQLGRCQVLFGCIKLSYLLIYNKIIISYGFQITLLNLGEKFLDRFIWLVILAGFLAVLLARFLAIIIFL